MDKFLEFQRQLQNEILRLEFNRKSSGSNTIPEKAFVELLIAYAGFPGTQYSKIGKKCNLKSTKTHFLQFPKWQKNQFLH